MYPCKILSGAGGKSHRETLEQVFLARIHDKCFQDITFVCISPDLMYENPHTKFCQCLVKEKLRRDQHVAILEMRSLVGE